MKPHKFRIWVPHKPVYKTEDDFNFRSVCASAILQLLNRNIALEEKAMIPLPVPNDVFTLIVRFLVKRDIYKCSLVNRNWNNYFEPILQQFSYDFLASGRYTTTMYNNNEIEWGLSEDDQMQATVMFFAPHQQELMHSSAVLMLLPPLVNLQSTTLYKDLIEQIIRVQYFENKPLNACIVLTHDREEYDREQLDILDRSIKAREWKVPILGIEECIDYCLAALLPQVEEEKKKEAKIETPVPYQIEKTSIENVELVPYEEERVEPAPVTEISTNNQTTTKNKKNCIVM